MKNKNFLFVVFFISLFTLSSCTFRLVDFTVISSKNVNLNIDRSQGIKTEGKKSYFLGIGWNVKDALDDALENAGPDYDLLIDGVVRYSSFIMLTVKVEGVAVNSKKMKASLGEKGFEKWCKENNIFDPNTVKAPCFVDNESK